MFSLPGATVLFEIVFFFSLTLRTRLARHLGFATLISIVYQAYRGRDVRGESNNIVGYTTLLFTQTAMACDFLVLTKDPHRTFRKLNDTAEIISQPFLTRLKWGFLLTLNPRGIGWDHCQCKYRVMETSRAEFLWNRAVKLTGSYIYFYLSSFVSRSSTSFFLREHLGLEVEIDPSGRIWNFVTSCVYLTRVVAYTNVLHLALVVPLVTMGVWKWEECPDLFGKWMDGWLISRVWG